MDFSLFERFLKSALHGLMRQGEGSRHHNRLSSAPGTKNSPNGDIGEHGPLSQSTLSSSTEPFELEDDYYREAGLRHPEKEKEK